ncbi:hypothetical protein GobsT_47270 [Gemmata obscuriglobus]|uniref:Uncharacterized protein n=1 Tax=Gemmata obscuriglobus TaxID=114 RepID=A0A2Z3GVI4_9BACT|nr:hypothetical protein [Gemmata obscuriglobus]AWM37318.1 hypothetical protein C1280_09970 [Gemmata obscuriglobus]QEG29928.1 hypothetical protein GobsT_47270 [Gemmata obscuriglobus]VTS09247.1 Uncharacterized protein OS=Myxococcus sp. (contaminant ex DSM 436) GN=A176_05815 PE=4 SV=1 [Gemmata obscuriglobus UQM 2246]
MVPLPTLDALDLVTIPTPCTVPWDQMSGDSRTRFCDQCRKNVHDVSELTRAEALDLLSASDRSPCLRVYRRPDGRVLTADCSTPRERIWKWLDRRSQWAAALFALLFFTGCDMVGAPKCSTGEAAPPGAPQPVAPVVTDGAVSIALGAAEATER